MNFSTLGRVGRHVRRGAWSPAMGTLGTLMLCAVAFAGRAQSPPDAAGGAVGDTAGDAAGAGAGEVHVVLVTDASAAAHVEETATRFAAELRAAGFALERVEFDGGQGPAQVEHRARERRAYAGLHVHGDAQLLRADVWLDGTRVHPGARRLSVEGSAVSPGDFALQLVEFLQAGLSDVRARAVSPVTPGKSAQSDPPRTTQPQPADGTGTESIPQLAHDPPLGIVLEAGAAALTSPPADDLLFGVQLGAGYLLMETMLVGMRTTLPLHDERYDAPQGSAYYQLWTALLRVEARVIRWHALSVVGALGGGFARLTARGQPDAPLRSRSDTVWSAVVSAQIGLHMALLSRLALTLDAGVAWWAPRPEVAIAQDSRTLGAPMLSLGLGIRVTL